MAIDRTIPIDVEELGDVVTKGMKLEFTQHPLSSGSN